MRGLHSSHGPRPPVTAYVARADLLDGYVYWCAAASVGPNRSTGKGRLTIPHNDGPTGYGAQWALRGPKGTRMGVKSTEGAAV